MLVRKRLMAGLVMAALALVSCGASAEESKYISLDEAEQIAQENSVSLRLAALELQQAEFQYKQAKAATIMRPSPTTILQAQSALDLAQQSYLMAKDKISLAVKTDFFNVLKMQNMVAIAAEGLESAKRHADVANKKLEAGTVTQLDVIKATRSVLSSQTSLFQAEQGLEMAIMKFYQTLGVGFDSRILPEASAFDYAAVDVDLARDQEFALANREEIKQLMAAIEVAKKSVELADNDYTPALTLEQAQLNLAKLEAQLEQLKQGLTLEIRQSYSELKSAEKRIPVLEKGVEEAAETLRLSELSYEADMITSNDLQDAQLGVQSAKNDLVSAIFDFNLAKAKYFHAVARALQGQSPER